LRQQGGQGSKVDVIDAFSTLYGMFLVARLMTYNIGVFMLIPIFLLEVTDFTTNLLEKLLEKASMSWMRRLRLGRECIIQLS
jgi:hypothetical protein